MDARDFLVLAKKLSAESGAAERRTSISRSYYAAYHAGIEVLSRLERLERRNFGLSASPEAHRRLVDLLKNSGDRELRNVGEELSRFRRRRNEADYELGLAGPEQPGAALQEVVIAERIIARLEGFVVGDTGRQQQASLRMAAWAASNR